MARSINKGPKPSGGYAKVSSKSLKDAQEKSAKRLAPRPEHPGLGKAARTAKRPPASVYGDAANSLQIALLGAQKHGIDKLDARMLLLHALGIQAIQPQGLGGRQGLCTARGGHGRQLSSLSKI